MIRSLAAVLLLMAVPATAQDVKAPETPLQRVAALPAEAAGWRRADVTDFEARPGGAGLGAAAEYRPVAGGPGVATVYLYDRAIPSGATAQSLDAERSQGAREIEMLGQMRRYRIEARLPGPVIAGPGGHEALRCEEFVLAFDGGNRADSYLCLGLAGRAFLKLRMTLPAGAQEAEAERLGALGGALVAAIR